MRAVKFPVELIIIKHARESRYNETRKLVLYSDLYISDIIIRRVYKRLTHSRIISNNVEIQTTYAYLFLSKLKNIFNNWFPSFELHSSVKIIKYTGKLKEKKN